MAKKSKTVKKVVKKPVKVEKTNAKTTAKKGATPSKQVEKILEAGLDSKVEYAYEDDSKQSKSGKGKDSKKGKKVLNIDKPKPTKVEKGHLVSVEYVGTLKSGEEFDNSKNHGPIQFVVGNGQVIPGFDTAVIGMKINDKKKFNIPKQNAYGDVNPALVQVIPLNKVPEHIRTQLKPGGFLVMQAPTGQQVPVKVVKLDKENVHLDMNHPLAGQDLTFEIKVVDINHAPENFGSCDCGDDCGDDCGSSCDCGHDHK
jgi:FKBP-type peptidyl-prolyl cis-trans isomerase 2